MQPHSKDIGLKAVKVPSQCSQVTSMELCSYSLPFHLVINAQEDCCSTVVKIIAINY